MREQAPKSTQSGKFSNIFRAAKTGLRNGFGCALFATVFAVPAQAQDAPPGSIGGAIRSDIERSKGGAALPPVSPKPAAEAPASPAARGETLVVTRFRFAGNTLLSDAALNRALAPYIGRPVDFDELQNAAAMAALAYRDRGYVATVSIPKQEIEGGIVTLKVAEARYGGAKIDPVSDGRIHSELILERIEHAMRLEKAVNTNVLDRALLLLNDLPGASVQGGLAEGDADGETQVVVQSQRKPVISGSAAVDRNGSVSTGMQRETIDVALNSPAGRGEQYTLSLMQSEGTRYGRLGFSLPVGLDGARAGVNASYLDYRVIDGPQVQSNLTGQSTSVSGDLSYPLIRSQQANLYASTSLTAKWFDNFAMRFATRSYETQLVAGSLSGNWYDGLFGGASNQVSASLSAGRIDLKEGQASDAAGPRVEGVFRKLNLSLARDQSLGGGFSLYGALSAQLASKNLDSSEKFYLGGAGGVRAYPTSEGGGSSGELLQVELRKRFDRGLELRVFRDEGRVQQNVTRDPSNSTPNVLHYRGYGVALIASLPSRLTLSVAWSRRLGENPNPLPGSSNPKRDQDGTRDSDRVWVSASLSF